MRRVAVTCLQLIRDLDAHRAPLDAAGWEVVTPPIAGQHLEGAELVDALRECAGVVAGDDRFTANVLDALPHLRCISRWGVGTDGVDLDAARRRGVTVTNTPGVFNDEVADVAMAYITMLARHLVSIDRGVRSGSWPKPPGVSLAGRTLGIIGLGGIGRAVAVRAAAARMVVIGADPSPESRQLAERAGVVVCELDELLARSDVLSVNCPSTAETHHLLNSTAFDLMRRGVHIVNTGRGSVIDTDALVTALRAGIVGACALDVLETEPPGRDHPLLGFDSVVLGSHNASNTIEASARVHDLAIRNLLEVLHRP